MKNFPLLLTGLLLLTSASAAARTVSENEAYALVQAEFSGSDVNYYQITNGDADSWAYFVDAEPLKGWEHDSYIMTVPKNTELSQSKLKPFMEYRSMPPTEYEMTPISIYNPMGSSVDDKPVVEVKQSTTNSAAAANTYAIILNGGLSPYANSERYWNDCSFMYQVLMKNFKLPKNHIECMISNGAGSAKDAVRLKNGELYTSPNDLDVDGTDDIDYVACMSNVEVIFRTQTRNRTDGDQVLFFVTGHGGLIGSEPFIALWNGEKLLASRLRILVSRLCAKGVSVNIVLGQCYSGAFLSYLEDIDGCVVATACGADEESNASAIRPYNEFVYFWTSAVNGYTAYNNITYADYNSDGRVTIDEAFRYAKLHDLTNETPQFNSNPSNLAENLALDMITLRSQLPAPKNIRKADVNELLVNEDDDAIYNLQGARVAYPQKGEIYVRRGRKFICK